MAAPPSFSQVLQELKGKQRVRPQLVERIFDTIFRGGWTPLQTGVFLACIDVVGQTPEVLVSAAMAARRAMVYPVPLEGRHLAWGSAAPETTRSLDIGPAVAAIVMAAGVQMPLLVEPQDLHPRLATTCDELGVEACVSGQELPAVRHVAGVIRLHLALHHPWAPALLESQRELGLPTFLQLLHPLIHPGSPSHYLLGAESPEQRRSLAWALVKLGVKRAWVVHSEDGLDVLSPHAKTHVTVISSSGMSDGVVSPRDFGVEPSPPGAMHGGSPRTNAALLRGALSNPAHPVRSGIVINAAAALSIAADLRLDHAARKARDLIEDGSALQCLNSDGLPRD